MRRIRVAFEVDDADGVTRRLEASAGSTLTLFEQPDGEERFVPVDD